MAAEPENSPQEVTPVKFNEDRYQPDPSEVDLSEAVEVTPFQLIERGEDTVNARGQVTFADFSPKILPADAPEEEIVPKDESAPAPVSSQESTQTIVQEKSEKNVPTPASKADGKAESGSQTSSSSTKTG